MLHASRGTKKLNMLYPTSNHLRNLNELNKPKEESISNKYAYKKTEPRGARKKRGLKNLKVAIDKKIENIKREMKSTCESDLFCERSNSLVLDSNFLTISAADINGVTSCFIS